jgi:(S)-2-hydroxyglutarate dehydrogenase
MDRRYDVAVIGGGIVGLATARALLGRGIRHVIVLEAEPELAAHQTGHNSGVIHSGLYYKAGSLKAQNCIAGREAMYRYCEDSGIEHRRSGKIIVATRTDELGRLEELQRRGQGNGLQDLRIIGTAELHELEPEVDAVAGMWIREAGIVNYGDVARGFAADILEQGGEIRRSARVVAVRDSPAASEVITEGGSVVASMVVNCGGLQSDRIARMCGVEPGVMIIPFRGEYYDVSPGARSLVRNPIYPVPDPAFPFLGVHLTPTIDGRVEAGPNAVLAFRREGYRRTDVSMRDLAEVLTFPGFRRLAADHWRYGLAEMKRSLLKRLFVRDLQRLVPRIQASDLSAGKSGVRAQAVDANGRLLDDFHIVRGDRSVHVLNAPSPAATASISIGRRIADDVISGLGLTAPALTGASI